MNKSELKDLVKNYFSLEDKNIETPKSVENFQSAKLVDGTPISNKSEDMFEVGQEVYVTTEAGEEVIAPSGEHALDNGDVLVVDGNGKITGLHKPDESGQGSLSKEEEAAEETLAEVKEEEAVELADDAINVADALPLAEHGDEESMDEHGDERAEIIEAIMAEIAPKIVEMQQKLEEHEVKMAEHDERMKEHYSAAEETSVTEKAFSKAGFGSKPEGAILSFNNGNLKSMQYENVLSRASKNNKK
jgi:hypothetical protein